MTIKEIKDRYLVYKQEKGIYYVYSKEEGGRSMHKYLTTLHKKTGTSFYVEGYKPTTKLSKLVEQIQSKIKSLPYDSDYYNPMLRKGLFEEFIIRDYMGSIGFSDNHSWSSGESGFRLKRESIYGYRATDITISFDGLEPEFRTDGGKETKDRMKINLWTGAYSWISTEVDREVEAIKEGINSLLNPLLVTEAAENLKTADMTSAFDVINSIENKLSGFDVIKGENKEKIKKRLNELLLKLE